jgi:RNA polymerase sigma factor (sigma-70 family)
MPTPERLADRFEAHRAHLRAVAYRMLGSVSDAEDAVQESWLRLSRSEAGDIESLRAWLTTVVARVCLDMLRTREARRGNGDPVGFALTIVDGRISAIDMTADPDRVRDGSVDFDD